MIKTNLKIENYIIKAELSYPNKDNGLTHPMWIGRSTDTFTNTVQKFALNKIEFFAIISLALDGESILPQREREWYYSIAEPAVKNWPAGCRPFP